MGGASLFLLKGRERTSAILAAVVCLALVLLTPQPRRIIVDGQEVAQIVAFGRVLPDWVFLAVFAPTFLVLWFGFHRLLDRLWPEGETVQVDKLYVRPDGGFVTWTGDDPEAGSPLDYVAPRLQTALDYLQAEEPAPMRILILGPDRAEEEERAFHEELARWLKESSEVTLQGLIPAIRSIGSMTDDFYFRLVEAHEARRVPTMTELASFADEIDNEDLREYVAERRAEEA